MSPSPRPPSGLPEPRFNQVAVSRVAGIVLAGVAAAIAAHALSIQPEIELGPGKSMAERRLHETLRALQGAYDPRERERILAAAPGHAREFAAPLQAMLRRPVDPLHAAAIDYVGAAGIVSFSAELERLAADGPPERRARAIRALGQLRPWSQEPIALFLLESHAAVLLAALEHAAPFAEDVTEQVVSLMAHDDAEVCTAAMDFLLAHPSELLWSEIWNRVELGDDRERIRIIELITAAGVAGDYEERLTRAFFQWSPDVQRVALAALASLEGPLQDPRSVWTWILEPNLDLEIRRRAIYCLESTRSVEPEQVRGQLSMLDPPLRTAAVRALLSAGDRGAVEQLLELADDHDPIANATSRQLLSWFTGCSVHVDVERYREVLAERPSLLERAMPPPTAF